MISPTKLSFCNLQRYSFDKCLLLSFVFIKHMFNIEYFFKSYSLLQQKISIHIVPYKIMKWRENLYGVMWTWPLHILYISYCDVMLKRKEFLRIFVR